ncbi:E3 ubiquitin-protein ligase APD2-like [Arachis duranensis]|uniref:E3 ubiquitin-protein ligase APD2-like n=1 Tax=Arachis duranensis TaxID=130453 RepID=A0A9C6TLR3_ARADU|nr:E3 ubiquitin-protein ligase APD2-like [Arachis duranensis]
MAELHSTSNSTLTPPPSTSAGNNESSGASPSTSRGRRNDQNAADRSQARFRSPEIEPIVGHAGRVIGWGIGDESSSVREDAWSCFAVVFTFWFFVSVTIILGVYGSMNLLLGPETSIVFQPSPLFVQYLRVENLEEKPGPVVYGTYQYPDLDVITTWEQTLHATIPSDTHQEWIYYLNTGSEVNISYHLSPVSSSVLLIIADGAESLAQWIEYPTYRNSTLSWNMIHGMTKVKINFILILNLCLMLIYFFTGADLQRTSSVKVELNLTVRAYLHNTKNAYYKYALASRSSCSLSIFFPQGNAAILTTPGPQKNASDDEWYVKVTYGPRWITYIVGIGGLTLLMFWAFNLLNNLQFAREERAGVINNGTAPDRGPLRSRKDDDLSSWGSSYDSLSQDDEDLDSQAGGSAEGKSLGDGEISNNTRRLCAICFDAPRDCFFLPCGHSAACFECGTRIAEAAGTCPVCRRNMKKVRKIFTV